MEVYLVVFWSCTLFQINPICQSFVEELFTSPKSEYIYQVWEKPDSEEEDLKVYIDLFSERKHGINVDIQMDRISKAYNVRGERPYRFRITVSLGIYLFKQSGWPALVGIFGAYENAHKLSVALKRIYMDATGKNDVPLTPVFLKLRERDEALLQAFPNMQKMKVTGIQGSQVRKAVVSGEMLQESPEYQKWVKDEDFCGKVEFFGVSVGDETVVLSTNGNMYSRQGKVTRPTSVVFHILQNLIQCNALVYFPTLPQMFEKGSS
jgi:hypothetical protein